MRVDVDEAGADDLPFGIDDSGACGGVANMPTAHRDLPVLDEHIANRVEAVDRIDDPPTSNQNRVRRKHSARRLKTQSRGHEKEERMIASPPTSRDMSAVRRYLPASGRLPWFAFFMRSFFSLRRRVLAMVPPRSSAQRLDSIPGSM
jgi:hypothetical protein